METLKYILLAVILASTAVTVILVAAESRMRRRAEREAARAIAIRTRIARNRDELMHFAVLDPQILEGRRK